MQHERWMNDAFIARYSNQDICMLRGVDQLNHGERLVLILCTAEWLRREVEPLERDPEIIPPDEPTP